MIAGAFAEQSAHTGGIDLSTKGDMHGYSTDDARIPISTNNFSLFCDSSAALGLKWAASPTSVLTTQSDILYASSANTLARLAKGSATQVLAMNSGATAPEWVTPSSGLWTQIGNYRATGEEASTSFSSLGVDLDNDYSKVVVIMSGKARGTGNGGVYLNAVSSGSKYIYTQILNDSSTVSGSLITENVINVLPTGLIDDDNSYFNLQLEITFSGIADNFMYQFSGGASHEGNVIGSGHAELASAGDELDTINISFAGDWQVGTQINVYKVAI